MWLVSDRAATRLLQQHCVALSPPFPTLFVWILRICSLPFSSGSPTSMCTCTVQHNAESRCHLGVQARRGAPRASPRGSAPRPACPCGSSSLRLLQGYALRGRASRGSGSEGLHQRGWPQAFKTHTRRRSPMSKMLLMASTPSILVSSWLTTVSCTPLPSRTEPLLLQMASISSKMMMCSSESSP